MEIKKNFPLIFGISIPIVMVLFVAASIYLPTLFAKPHSNFLYASGIDYPSAYPGDYVNPQYQYSVQNGMLQKDPIKQVQSGKYQFPPLVQAAPKLYIYDVSKNENTEISFGDAQKLILDPNSKSPDGFEIVAKNNNDGFFPFFWGGNSYYNARFLKGHGFSKKLDLRLETVPYPYAFNFLGWIK